MKRFIAFAIAILLTPAALNGQSGASPTAKIRNAMAAAPASISAGARVVDWPAKEGGELVQLRDGSNGWTCFPDMPMTEGNDPQCLDATFMTWVKAYVSHSTPQLQRVGIGYMIAPGGASGSNTDPYASAPTADNEWGYDPPHLMVVVPDPAALDGLPTARGTGPWVMWKGTPYVHLMVPLESGKK